MHHQVSYTPLNPNTLSPLGDTPVTISPHYTSTNIRIKAFRQLQAHRPDLFQSPTVTPGFEWACPDAERPLRRARWLGVTGGDHIFRDTEGCVWRVDLVIEKTYLCVGLLPEEWEHPPIAA